MKAKIRIKNGLRDKIGTKMGDSDMKTGVVRINVRAHKKDKRDLASTIKHELLHVKHPKMTEKQAYKRSKKTSIGPEEQSKLLAKLKRKSVNYKVGVLKRKYKLGRGDTKPGEFINRINNKRATETEKAMPSKEKVAFAGLV